MPLDLHQKSKPVTEDRGDRLISSAALFIFAEHEVSTLALSACIARTPCQSAQVTISLRTGRCNAGIQLQQPRCQEQPMTYLTPKDQGKAEFRRDKPDGGLY